MTTDHPADAGDDEFESPFANVPSSDAGPLPFQDGYWTYEKTFAAMGRTTNRNSGPALRGVAIVGACALLLLVALGLALALLR
jgi:hypothetical protein